MCFKKYYVSDWGLDAAEWSVVKAELGFAVALGIAKPELKTSFEKGVMTGRQKKGIIKTAILQWEGMQGTDLMTVFGPPMESAVKKMK